MARSQEVAPRKGVLRPIVEYKERVRSRECKSAMITLVIPFYNEEAVLANTIRRAEDYLETTFSEHELILVDDGSTDASLGIARKYESHSVRVLAYRPNRGKGHAVRVGMLSARGDAVFFCDADLSYGLEVLKTGYDKLIAGHCDVIVGSRSIGEDGYKSYPLVRKIASRGFVSAVNAVLGLGVSDCQCGFKGFKRAAAKRIFGCARIDGFAFDMEALYVARQMRYRIEEMPVRLLIHGESKVHVVRESFLMFRDVLKVRLSSRCRRERKDGE